MSTSLIWLGRFVVLMIGLALVGAMYESVAEAADAKAYPAPGELVDVGGYRLHINCTGTGSPTVVIVAGLGDWSTSWGGVVQPEVAKTTRGSTYDRAGLGWSDGILIFPVLKQHSQRMVMGYLAFRIVKADAATYLRIGSATNKELILLLEFPHKPNKSDSSGRLPSSDKLRARNEIWSLAHAWRRARFLERKTRNRRQWVPDKAPTHSITT